MAQSVSVFEGQAVLSRSKGQEQHPLSVGLYHSSRTTFPPSFSDPSSFTSLFLISTRLLLLSKPDGLLTICFLAHWSTYFRRAFPIAFTTIASSRALLFNEYCQWPFPHTTHCRSPVDPCVGLWPVVILRREVPHLTPRISHCGAQRNPSTRQISKTRQVHEECCALRVWYVITSIVSVERSRLSVYQGSSTESVYTGKSLGHEKYDRT